MSDLHRAIEDEIDSFRPDRTPPFSALQARKRTRDRRRYALSGVALSVAAVAGVAVVSALPGDRLVTPNTVAAPAPSATASAASPAATDDQDTSFWVRHLDEGFVNPGTAERLDACLSSPGVEHVRKPGTALNYSVNVTGTSRSRAFAACVKALGTDGLVLTEQGPPPLETDADIAAFVMQCVGSATVTAKPELVGMTEEEAFPVNARSALRVLGRDGVCNMGSLVIDGIITDVVLVDGIVAWAGVLTLPATEPSTRQAVAGPQVLLHHCGIQPVTFADRKWEVKEAPFDATNAPSTFSGEGTYTLDGDSLVFADRAGARLVFRPDDGMPNGLPCA